MNNKESELYRILDIVIECCATKTSEDRYSITKEDVLGKSRSENVVMTRCILVHQILSAGYTCSTVAQFLGRTEQAVRHMVAAGYAFQSQSRAYRIANAEATLRCSE